MGRFPLVSAVQLSSVILLLLTVCVNAPVASALPLSHSARQDLSNSSNASSATQYSWYHCYPWDPYWCYPYYWSYYCWPYPYYYGYYYPTTAADTVRTFDLEVETNPPEVAPVRGAGTYNQGAVASFSLTSMTVPFGANERYVFSHWSGDFSGDAPSGSITIDSEKTVVANYQLENYLEVSVDPPGIAAPVGGGWYRSDESLTVGAVPPVVLGAEGIRYVFEHWAIDAVPVSGNPVQVTMNGPHTAEARYKAQYLLTVSSEYGIVDGGGWYDAGSSATFSVTTQVDTSYGVKQVFDRWTGDYQSTSPVVTVTMDSPLTVRAAWRTDSTILYETIGIAVGGAFLLGTGLTVIAITRRQQTKPMPQAQGRPVLTPETAPKKPRSPRSRKRTKPQPKSDHEEASPQA